MSNLLAVNRLMTAGSRYRSIDGAEPLELQQQEALGLQSQHTGPLQLPMCRRICPTNGGMNLKS